MTDRILVIDDEAAVRRSFELSLRDRAVEVVTAETGAAGLELHGSAPFNLIFLDLNMPGMDGVEVLRRLRADDPDVPVLIITAFQTDYLAPLREASEQGMRFELLRKPLNADQIREATAASLAAGRAATGDGG